VTWRVEDEKNDWVLFAPIYERYYGVVYTADAMPGIADIRLVDVRRTAGGWRFGIKVGGNLEVGWLDWEGRLQYGIGLEVDGDGDVDLYVLCDDWRGGVVVRSDGTVVGQVACAVYGDRLVVDVESDIVADVRDWVVWSGVALPPGRPIEFTSNPDIWMAPWVDRAGWSDEKWLVTEFIGLYHASPENIKWQKINIEKPERWKTHCLKQRVFADGRVLEIWWIVGLGYGCLVYEDRNGNRKWDKDSEWGTYIGRCPYEGGRNTLKVCKRPLPDGGEKMAEALWYSADGGKVDDDKDKRYDRTYFLFKAEDFKRTLTIVNQGLNRKGEVISFAKKNFDVTRKPFHDVRELPFCEDKAEKGEASLLGVIAEPVRIPYVPDDREGNLEDVFEWLRSPALYPYPYPCAGTFLDRDKRAEVTWKLLQGKLPEGLELDASGLLKRKKEKLPITKVDVEVCGRYKPPGRKRFQVVRGQLTIIIHNLRILTEELPPATAGQPYKATIRAEGGIGNLDWKFSPKYRWLDIIKFEGRRYIQLMSNQIPERLAGRTVRILIMVKDEKGNSFWKWLSLKIIEGER